MFLIYFQKQTNLIYFAIIMMMIKIYIYIYSAQSTICPWHLTIKKYLKKLKLPAMLVIRQCSLIIMPAYKEVETGDPGLVDFTVGLLDFIVHLLFEEINLIHHTCKTNGKNLVANLFLWMLVSWIPASYYAITCVM